MKTALLKLTYGIILTIWLSIGGYSGSAGYTKLKIDELNSIGKGIKSEKTYKIKNVSFSNPYFMEAYLEERKATEYFPAFFLTIPNILVLLITACSFGVLGSLTFIVKRMAIDNELLVNAKVISVPILGALTGVIVLGLATTAPVLLVSGESALKPLTLVFLCFFGGFFNSKFFDWLNNTIGHLFLTKE